VVAVVIAIMVLEELETEALEGEQMQQTILKLGELLPLIVVEVAAVLEMVTQQLPVVQAS
jgi:hypothetical protein